MLPRVLKECLVWQLSEINKSGPYPNMGPSSEVSMMAWLKFLNTGLLNAEFVKLRSENRKELVLLL